MSSRTRRQELRRAKGHSPTKSKPYDKNNSTTGQRLKKSTRSNSPLIAPLFFGESSPSSPRDLGMPSRSQYKGIENEYLTSLHARKQEKALLSQELFDKIWDVLHDPGSARVGTPQFRWWVRKMFVLSYPPATLHTDDVESLGGGKTIPVVLHENRPVAIKDQIYDVLCYCHQVANHGGRDKTTAVIRDHYSWIPKELIAQFVKACPTCVFKKTGNIDLAISMKPEDKAAVGSEPCDLGPAPPAVTHCVPLPISNMMDFRDRARSPSPALKLWMPTPGPAPSVMSHPMPALTWSDSSSYDTRSTYWSMPSYTSTQAQVSDMRSQPGSSKVALDAPVMRRFNSSDQRITLPPLMKTLSEGMLGVQVPYMRPQLNFPDNFGLSPTSEVAPEDWYRIPPERYSREAWTPDDALQRHFTPQIDPALLQDEQQSRWTDGHAHSDPYTLIHHDPTPRPIPASPVADDARSSARQVTSPNFMRKDAADSFLLPLGWSSPPGSTSGLRDPRRSVENLVEPFGVNPAEIAGTVRSPTMFQTPFVSPSSSLDDAADAEC